MNVLVIDDNAGFLLAVVMMLRNLGADVDTASTAEEALSKVRGRNYDFVLVDLQLPDQDGIWFVRHAGLSPATRVIAMCGFLPGGVVAGLRSLGLHGVLLKPFDSDSLMDVLDAHSDPARALARERGAA